MAWGALGWHQSLDISLVLKAQLQLDMVMFLVIFFMSFQTSPENRPFPSAFTVRLDGRGGSGGPPGASRWAFRRPEAASNCSYFVGFKGIIATGHAYVSADLFHVFSDIS